LNFTKDPTLINSSGLAEVVTKDIFCQGMKLCENNVSFIITD